MIVGYWVGWRDIVEKGAEEIVKEAWDAGANQISVFVVAGGKVFFNPMEKYGDFKPIKGCQQDILEETIKAAKNYGIKVTATLVCVVDPEHAKRFPGERQVDFNGKVHGYTICPNSRLLREYLTILARDIASRYEVEEIELDYIRFKRSRDETLLPIHLFTGRHCYCSRCKKLAGEEGVDLGELEEALNLIRRLSKPTRENLEEFKRILSLGGVASLYSRYPALVEWLNFRYKSIARLVASIKEAVAETGVKLSADLFYPTLSWQVGQNYTLLGEYLDTVKPMIYTARMGAWETSYLRKLLDKLGWEYEQFFLDYVSMLLGIPKPKSVKEFEYKGVSPDIAKRETILAKEMLPSKVKVYTGLYSVHDPDRVYNPPQVLEQTIEAALQAKPEGLYFFTLTPTPAENRKTIRSKLIN